MKTLRHNDVMYFCGTDVGRCLVHTNPRNAVRQFVDEEYRIDLGDLLDGPRKDGHTVYVTEPGLYTPTLSCQTPIAKVYKKWVCQDLLSRVRKASMVQCHAPLALRCEADLHHKVIDFIRRFYQQVIIAPGLGELQDSREKRSYGYSCGHKR